MPARGGRGGRRGGGSGGGGGAPREVQVSKKISWLLRHGAESEGLTLGPGGFLTVDQVLSNRKIRSLQVTFDEIREVVQDNDKQRFTMVPASSLKEDGTVVVAAHETGEDESGQTALASDDPKYYLIRANQGHSIKVESESLLKPITTENMLEVVVHGTTHSAWPLIVSSGGLKPMGRNHAHFAAGLPAGFKSIVDDDNNNNGDDTKSNIAAPVISGMRKSSTVLMFLDLHKAMEVGIKFWLSDNGVILSEGNSQGLVPLDVFKRVEDRTGEGVLLQDGQLVKDVPAKWKR